MFWQGFGSNDSLIDFVIIFIIVIRFWRKEGAAGLTGEKPLHPLPEGTNGIFKQKMQKLPSLPLYSNAEDDDKCTVVEKNIYWSTQ